LIAELDRTLPPDAPVAERDLLARRQANAATALLQLGELERVWPLLQHRPDPSLRTYLIHRFAPLGVDPRLLRTRLESPGVEASEQRALILALGEYTDEQLPGDLRHPLIAYL